MRPGSLITTLWINSWDNQLNSYSNICCACRQPASGQNRYRHIHSMTMAASNEPNITPRKWKGVAIRMPRKVFCPSCCCWAFSAMSAIRFKPYDLHWPSGESHPPDLPVMTRSTFDNREPATSRYCPLSLCAFLRPGPAGPWA